MPAPSLVWLERGWTRGWGRSCPLAPASRSLSCIPIPIQHSSPHPASQSPSSILLCALLETAAPGRCEPDDGSLCWPGQLGGCINCGKQRRGRRAQTEELEAAIDPSAALPWSPASCSGTQAGSEGAGWHCSRLEVLCPQGVADSTLTAPSILGGEAGVRCWR